MRFLSLPYFTALSAVMLLLSSASLADAAQKSCRRCGCNVVLSGTIVESRIKEFMDHMALKITGGEGWYWVSEPNRYNGWKGTAQYWRLCGNGELLIHDWKENFFPGGWTNLHLYCDACVSVQCKEGSACENSGI